MGVIFKNLMDGDEEDVKARVFTYIAVGVTFGFLSGLIIGATLPGIH